MIDVLSFAKKLFSSKSVALICHVRPDGDTIGSTCALMRALKSVGVDAEAFCADEIPTRFFFLEETKNIKNQLTEKEFTAFVAVDCADITRLGTFASKFSKSKNTFVIDHHISNNRYANLNYVVDNASNCENVYNLLKSLSITIDKETANLLALGIVTDTGGFKHKNVTADTLSVASDLVKLGADLNAISYNMFSKQSKERAMLFSKTMSKIQYYHNNRVGIATVRYEDFALTGANQDETEGFIDFVLGIDSVEIAICIMETEKKKFKISFRSKGPNVNELAGRFGGGGHVLASGCKINGAYEEVLDKLQFTAGQFIED